MRGGSCDRCTVHTAPVSVARIRMTWGFSLRTPLRERAWKPVSSSSTPSSANSGVTMENGTPSAACASNRCTVVSCA